MSYISAEKINDNIIIWERDKDGKRITKTRSAPYYFYTKDRNGKYTSMYGDKLSRQDFLTSRSFYETKKTLKQSGMELFESDIPAEIKYLSEHYYNKPAPVLNVTMLDIEVDYDPEYGHASTADPYAPINAVALCHMWLKKYVVLAIPPNMASRDANDDEWVAGDAPQDFIDEMHEIAEMPPGMELEILFFENEKDLIIRLLKEIQDSDAICGWHSEMFDFPYIAKRAERLGKKYFRMLSFPEAKDPKFRTIEKFGHEEEVVDIGGRIGADYMVLFKKYEMAERPSYKLASIADEILPELPKLEYEGSLAQQYRENFAWFVRYNIRDTEILQGFEERLGYMDLANKMMHLSTAIWKNVVGTLKLAEYSVVNYCHNELGGLIVNDMHPPKEVHRIQGAFVLIPQTGSHDQIGAIDINSLYPSSIRAINMSPETLLGQFFENTKAAEEIAKNSDRELTIEFDDNTQVPDYLRGKTVTAKASQWRGKLKQLKWAVSGYGTVFNQNAQGVIPKILEDWYNTRKKYQKLKATSDDPIKKVYYDKLQYTYKIKLNAFYGALTNQYFRFFDLRIGESTTGTGRMILLHQCAKTCELVDSEYVMPDVKTIDSKTGKTHFGYSDKWSVIYGDTDSTYFKTHGKDTEEAIVFADAIGKMVNASFPQYMKETFLCNEGYYDKIKCGREIVSDRGIFVDKKMYMLHIVDNEGETVDKMKVMGLQMKKTTLPAAVSKVLIAFVERFLKGEDWEDIELEILDFKESLENTENIMEIGLPTGIKKIEAYTTEYKVNPKVTLPGHIAAAIHYNKCLDDFNDNESIAITTGMKIKVFWLTQRHGKFKSLAIPVDIETIPQWFLDNFIVDRKSHAKKLVDKPLEAILNAIGKEAPSRQKILTDQLLSF